MSKKKKENQKSRPSEEGWPLGKATRKGNGENGFDRFSRSVHGTLVRLLSNLRLSLTLRIALHFSGQLLLTTLPVLAAAMIALCVAQWPAADRALGELAAMTPAQDGVYTQEQLVGLPFTEAYLLPQPYEGGLPGMAQRLALLFTDFNKDGQRRVMLYVDTVDGGVAAAWPVDDLIYQMNILFWVLLCLDLYRVGYFLNHRDRLNRRVLKPITDMAETAATLSANNLSDRISVEGTKNELKDLALVINGMLDRIELSYNSQKQFVSDASHELRTPIAVIQGYAAMLEQKGDVESRTRLENVRELRSSILTYLENADAPSLSGFLEEIALYTDIEQYDRTADAVVMMTVHSAKGLEFPEVYLVGAEDGLFPSARAIGEPEEMEEERRLCYVAITRAKRRLTITCAHQRMLYGRTTVSRPSRFLTEIPEELVERKQHTQPRFVQQAKPRPRPTMPHSDTLGSHHASGPVIDFRKGDTVEHDVFGRGLVLSVLPTGNDKMLEIAFDQIGTKRLMANFAASRMRKL